MLFSVVVRGKVAAHGCKVCGGTVFGVCLDSGTVPRATLCRNMECYGVAEILTGVQVPDPRMICWEWFRPTQLERQLLKHTDPEQYVATEAGDLCIRPRNVDMAKGEHVIVGS